MNVVLERLTSGLQTERHYRVFEKPEERSYRSLRYIFRGNRDLVVCHMQVEIKRDGFTAQVS